MDIYREDGESKGRYWARPDGGPVAEMTYSRAGTGMIIIDHTDVPPQYRGQGIGAALVARAVSDARREGIRIMPLCPFAAAEFRRHGEWQDILA